MLTLNFFGCNTVLSLSSGSGLHCILLILHFLTVDHGSFFFGQRLWIGQAVSAGYMVCQWWHLVGLLA